MPSPTDADARLSPAAFVKLKERLAANDHDLIVRDGVLRVDAADDADVVYEGGRRALLLVLGCGSGIRV